MFIVNLQTYAYFKRPFIDMTVFASFLLFLFFFQKVYRICAYGSTYMELCLTHHMGSQKESLPIVNDYYFERTTTNKKQNTLHVSDRNFYMFHVSSRSSMLSHNDDDDNDNNNYYYCYYYYSLLSLNPPDN